MKALNILKKNKLLVLVALVYGIIFIAAPQTAMKSVGNSVYYLVEMLQVLPVIFLLTVVIEAWVPKELIMRGFGEKSGFKGNLLSLLWEVFLPALFMPLFRSANRCFQKALV